MARDDLATTQSAGPHPRLEDQIAAQRLLARRQLRRARAVHWLNQYPPDPNDLLPTRLGNVLRAGERRAGERYGWDTVVAWPRLYVGLPEPIAIAFRSAVDAVDAAAVFCLTFFMTVAVLTAVAFIDDVALWWVPVAAIAISAVCYRGAVASAVTQGLLQEVAFDRHRFELLEAFHLSLPDTTTEEYEQAGRMSDFFKEVAPEDARAARAGERYSHAGPELGRGEVAAQGLGLK